MYTFLNKFLNSDNFNKLPKFLTRKIFKIFKIFFVETNLKTLPDENHPNKINKNQFEILKNNDNDFYRPFSTCSFLLELLTLYENSNKKKFSILDYGANNLDNYVYLNRYLNNWEYLYHDLPSYNNHINELIKEHELKNIKVINDIKTLSHELDFVFFGSSIHYIKNYEEVLKKISSIKSKFLIFSHTPFYTSNKNDKDIVMKQVNIHPTINYAYLIEYNKFINFMEKNNYRLISQNKNNFIKFLNFRNFKDFSFLSFLDLSFKYMG